MITAVAVTCGSRPMGTQKTAVLQRHFEEDGKQFPLDSEVVCFKITSGNVIM